MPRSRSDSAFDCLLLVCMLVHAVWVVRQPWIYVADDALFYFQIAYNVGHGHGLTFSGLMPTNGFHPFWLLVCVPFGWLASSKQWMLTSISVLIVLLNTATSIAARDLFRRAGLPHPSAAVLFAAPYLFFALIGTEGHLSALLLVLTMRAAHVFARQATPANLIRTACFGGLVVFSRMDLAILLAPLGVWSIVRYLAPRHDRLARLRHLGLALCVAAAPVSAFVLTNYLAFGDPIPVSGLLKLEGAGIEGLSTPFSGIVLLYLAVASAGATAAAFAPRSDFDEIHIHLTIGVIAFLGYLLLMTSEAYTWYYYSWAVISMSGVAILLQRVGRVASALPAPNLFVSRAPLGFAAAAALFGVASMLRYGEGIPQPAPFSHPETGLAERARQAGIVRVFAFDRPGQLAFYEDLSVLAADGLTTNVSFQKELAARGIHWALDELRIQAIVVPRLGEWYGHHLCGSFYLASLRFVCDEGHGAQISRFEVMSRLNGASLGWVDLGGRPRLAFSPDLNLSVVLLDERRWPGSSPR
jgi:hypothetical protein